VLHIIQPHPETHLSECISVARQGDVIAILPSDLANQQLTIANQLFILLGHHCNIIFVDDETTELTNTHGNTITQVTFAELVDYCAQHSPIHTWY